MGTVALVLCFIFLGFLTGNKIIPKNKKVKFADIAMLVSLYLVIFLLGTIIGMDENVISSLASIGLISFILAVTAMAGSAAAVSGLRRLLGIDRNGIRQHE